MRAEPVARVRGILFDFHETLISADRWFAMETGGIAIEILQALGVWTGEPPAEDRRRVEQAYAQVRAVILGAVVEYSARDIGRVALRAIGRDGAVADRDLDGAVDALFRGYLSDVRAKPLVPETLEALRGQGFRMGIVSNAAYPPFLDWALRDLGLRHYFQQIIVSANLGIRKPRREIFTAALDAMGLAAGEAVYVGNDYLKDVMGAQLAGLRAVWVPDPSAKDYRSYTAVRPDAVAERFALLPNLIDRMHTAREVIS